MELPAAFIKANASQPLHHHCSMAMGVCNLPLPSLPQQVSSQNVHPSAAPKCNVKATHTGPGCLPTSFEQLSSQDLRLGQDTNRSSSETMAPVGAQTAMAGLPPIEANTKAHIGRLIRDIKAVLKQDAQRTEPLIAQANLDPEERGWLFAVRIQHEGWPQGMEEHIELGKRLLGATIARAGRVKSTTLTVCAHMTPFRPARLLPSQARLLSRKQCPSRRLTRPSRCQKAC